jgi:pimeloyl-ACP methyl ester carboxylesterase
MWRSSTLPTRQAGPLHVRTAGLGDTVTVLLHGLVATGDIFGAAFDQLTDTTTVVVPDLLGFGRSIDETRSQFTPDDHLDALDHALADLGLADRSLVVGAHSMGSAIALRWIERRRDQIASISCFGPPVYPDAAAVNATIASSGVMAQAFVANNELAQIACRLNCSHRKAAGIAAGLATPKLPWPVAKAASLHTWPAYRDAMDLLIPHTDWTGLTRLACDLDVPVAMVWGSDDRIGDRSYASGLRGVALTEIPGAGHHLPMTHANLCVELLRDH